MIHLRPIAPSDLPRLVDLARQATYGLTSLPPDEAVLERRIAASQRAFADVPERPDGRTYLFALCDDDGTVQGVSGIIDKVGGFQPFWTYRCTVVERRCEQLDIHRRHEILELEEIYDGPTEIGSLFLAPGFRRRGAGRFLSLARFLFMAEHPERFEDTVIAEMRGVVDADGLAPFWEALGRHFFGMDYPDADYLSVSDKRFIADLMPRHPIYTCLLSAAARRAIGQVHPDTRPAQELLVQEGFRPTGQVDPFEAGPVLGCSLAGLGVVRRSRSAVVCIDDDAAADLQPAMALCEVDDRPLVSLVWGRKVGDALHIAGLPQSQRSSLKRAALLRP